MFWKCKNYEIYRLKWMNCMKQIHTCKTVLRSWETRASEIQDHHCLYIKIKTRPDEHENCLSFYVLREYYILPKITHNFINYTILR